MPVAPLPAEILGLILDSVYEGLHACCLVSKAFQALTLPRLYDTIDLSFYKPVEDAEASEPGAEPELDISTDDVFFYAPESLRLLQLLADRPSLAGHVRLVSVWSSSSRPAQPPQFATSLPALSTSILRLLPNVESFQALLSVDDDLPVNNGAWISSSRTKELEVSNIQWAPVARLPKLRKLEIAQVSIGLPVISSSILEELKLGHDVKMETFAGFHPSFDCMRKLSLSAEHIKDVDMSLLPNLVSLDLTFYANTYVARLGFRKNATPRGLGALGPCCRRVAELTLYFAPLDDPDYEYDVARQLFPQQSDYLLSSAQVAPAARHARLIRSASAFFPSLRQLKFPSSPTRLEQVVAVVPFFSRCNKQRKQVVITRTRRSSPPSRLIGTSRR
ncbi:hypothetical protein JCM10212_006424 [Sporobolomyces blumeae]